MEARAAKEISGRVAVVAMGVTAVAMARVAVRMAGATGARSSRMSQEEATAVAPATMVIATVMVVVAATVLAASVRVARLQAEWQPRG